ncbi:nucleotide exchange factor GrpE [candidate division WWE3 bacterium]|nr:nucleotide exchange factor GrpE [candidate division WWE3 bacterium]
MREDEIAEKNKRIEELENNWKRALADYRNLERRYSEEKDALFKFANLLLLERLVPVLDNLETLSKHNDDKGLEIIINQFRELLRDEGVEEMNVLMRDFDPQLMEAVEVVEGGDNKVMQVVVKGYKMNDKILRPARVKVGRKSAGDEGGN